MPKLIGTGLNQVPTNSMLGGMAYQSPDNVAIKNLDLQSLSQYNITIPSTAVDVFVYDTRKDSDGGAWRKRTQHTSWYNETLNTATRGSRRDFPAVAVIVATQNDVTIYDGDDPDMPMWMVFNSGNVAGSYVTHFLGRGNTALSGCVITSISMLNGILVVGKTYVSNFLEALTEINFIKEDATHSNQDVAVRFNNTSIISRNGSAGGYYTISRNLVHWQINDVAMTVLPNAPIDPSTGLPVPTIAVATAAGLSVIRDNGTVENTDIANIIKLGFVKNDRLAYGHRAGYAYQGIVLDIAPFRNSATYGWYVNQTAPSFSGYTLSDIPGAVEGVGDGNVYAWSGSTGGIRRISENISSPTNGMVNYITTSYNTGWMHGDIKGAWLSDTSTASVTGTELITNGTFTTNTSGWTARNGGTISVVSGALRVNANGNAYGGVAQTITTTAGKQYVLTLTSGTITNATQFNVIARDYYASTNLAVSAVSANSNNIVIYFTAINTLTDIIFESINNTSSIFDVDNVSVRITELDRSVNNEGLAVYGTLTKTAVATGADLVGYSGWSKSNYLLRSGPDLNNSSMTFMTWYKCSSISEEEALISTGDYNTISEVRALYVAPSGIAGFSGWANDVTPGSRSVRDDIWHHLAVTLQYISGNSYVVSVYVDGVLTGTSERTLLTFSNTAIDIGGGTLPLNRFARGSLALCRISTSVISANLMFKIYNDEKVLFQENSKAVLYGSSDAVTAIAYDDTTKLLHVGTSSGRSDFQGLERINNTTTAVTTAISASNGLIAEQ